MVPSIYVLKLSVHVRKGDNLEMIHSFLLNKGTILCLNWLKCLCKWTAVGNNINLSVFWTQNSIPRRCADTHTPCPYIMVLKSYRCTLQMLQQALISQKTYHFVLERRRNLNWNSAPKHLNWLINLFGAFLSTNNIPKCEQPLSLISWQNPHTFKKSVLPFHELIMQLSQIDLGTI